MDGEGGEDLGGGWTRLGRRVVVEDPFLTLRADALRDPRGNRLDPFWQLHYPDWVEVVALTGDDRLVLVRQYRHGLGGPALELPAGRVDPGEGPVGTARRELLEETGHAAASLRLLASLSPNPATHTNRVHAVLALGCERVAEPRPEAGEDLSVELLPVAEVLAGLESGIIPNAMHVSALLLGLRAAGRIAF